MRQYPAGDVDRHAVQNPVRPRRKSLAWVLCSRQGPLAPQRPRRLASWRVMVANPSVCVRALHEDVGQLCGAHVAVVVCLKHVRELELLAKRRGYPEDFQRLVCDRIIVFPVPMHHHDIVVLGNFGLKVNGGVRRPGNDKLVNQLDGGVDQPRRADGIPRLEVKWCR